ncbi:MAG: phosphodiester glycosidase family protein, partial [Candidatus Omnitrophica bacterium]|nr:phosphodiester glycosidase family protein [Candidatus Omnitrophota bacterium]
LEDKNWWETKFDEDVITILEKLGVLTDELKKKTYVFGLTVKNNYARDFAFKGLDDIGALNTELKMRKYITDLKDEKLQGHSYPPPLYYTLKTLGKIGPAAQVAIPVLINLLGDEWSVVREAAAEAYLKIAGIPEARPENIGLLHNLSISGDIGIKENLLLAQENRLLLDLPMFLPLIQVLKQKGITTEHLVRLAAPAAKEAIGKYFSEEKRKQAMDIVVALALRIRQEHDIPACSTIQYGVPLAAQVSENRLDWFERDLRALEGLAVELGSVNPYEVLHYGRDAILKFGTNPTEFEKAVGVTRIIPQWFKAARDKGLEDMKLQEAVPVMIERSSSIEGLRQGLQKEIASIGQNVYESGGESIYKCPDGRTLTALGIATDCSGFEWDCPMSGCKWSSAHCGYGEYDGTVTVTRYALPSWKNKPSSSSPVGAYVTTIVSSSPAQANSFASIIPASEAEVMMSVQKELNGRIRFDHREKKFYLDGSLIQGFFSGYLQDSEHLVGLNPAIAGRDFYAVPYGNLFHNSHFVVFQNGTIYHQDGEFDFATGKAVNERTYTCFVVSQNGEKSIERLTFIKGVHGKKDEIYNAYGQDISGIAQLAIYGQQIIREGNIVAPKSLTEEFADFNQLTQRYQHSFIGLTKEGELIIGAIGGNRAQGEGVLLGEMAEFIKQNSGFNTILLGNGGDVNITHN